MVSFNNQLIIKIKREIVFDFISKLENIPLWNYYVIKVNPISELGTKDNLYKQTRINDSQIIKIANKDFPNSIKIQTVGENNFEFERTLKLMEDDEGNTILDDTFFIYKGFPKLAMKLFKHKIKAAVHENLKKLKELLETGETVLQNGKISKFKQ